MLGVRMAKNNENNNFPVFPEFDHARLGANHKRNSLFIPRILRTKAHDVSLQDERQEQAYKIICKWASLETSGKLANMNERKLEGEFLADVFGKALGYKFFSENDDTWDIEAQYSVNGGTADAAIGTFAAGQNIPPLVLIELKGPNVNLDRDRFNGRTAIQQCWDYLNNVPDCPWGLVCNFVSFRLYHRTKSSKTYQQFLLSDLANRQNFNEFYYILERGGFIPETAVRPSRATSLLDESNKRQKLVGDDLYRYYDSERVRLIDHLSRAPHKKPLDEAIRIAQKLVDRIIFIAFCEDRNLLPENSIKSAHDTIAPFGKVTNPRWRNFIDLFRSIDEGNKRINISAYNGGLFRKDDEVDNLELSDNWTDFFYGIAKYDFREEVNVDVLGHIFERSIKEIERIKSGALFGEQEENIRRMQKSAERKRGGIYYTPEEFTTYIVNATVGKIIDERFAEIAQKEKIDKIMDMHSKPNTKMARYLRKCYDALKDIKIVDPACGSGAFLIKAYELLEDTYRDIVENLIFHEGTKVEKDFPDISAVILTENIFGVDLSREAVEITQLALWIRSAQKNKSLANLSRNIVCRNSLVTDTEVDHNAINWHDEFPDVFGRKNGGFDCVIGNPPWERIKLQEREFFDNIDPEIAGAVNAADRKRRIEKLKKDNPEVYERYLQAKKSAESTLNHVRNAGNFPLTGKGDINTYAVFAELAFNIVASDGQVGLLVLSGIATDKTTMDFFGKLVDSQSLVALYDFENKKRIFADVHQSLKFSILLYGGKTQKCEASDFVFFSHDIRELDDKHRHIDLSADDIKLLNPNTKTCPIFRSQRDAEIVKAIYRRVPVFYDRTREDGGNPWGIRFLRMFDQTNDAKLFVTAEKLLEKKYKLTGNIWKKGKSVYLPLYEAKMVQMYDHRAAGVKIDESNWFRQGQTVTTELYQHQNVEFSVMPRWWTVEEYIKKANQDLIPSAYIAFKNVTSPTNRRTMIASFIPGVGVINSAPLIITDESLSVLTNACLLANLNSFILDFIVRQKIGNVNLNFFIIEQLPIFSTEFYNDRCPWNKRQTLAKWISDRTLKLTCTSNDMIPLAKAAGFDPPVHKWKPDERAELMAELDAAYFILYGINRDDAEYILSTFSGTEKESDGLFDVTSTKNRILKKFDQFHEKMKS